MSKHIHIHVGKAKTKDGSASFTLLHRIGEMIKQKAGQVMDAASEEERSRAEAYLRDIIQTAQNGLR